MKRELKHSSEIDERVLDLYCRAYPDEKGIETLMIMVRNGHRTALQSLSRWKGNWNILNNSSATSLQLHCRAYPDEKGIETWRRRVCRRLGPDCRAYPDEKGIETRVAARPIAGDGMHCRAYPDEKGIETKSRQVTYAKPIQTLQSLSRWKGNWNGEPQEGIKDER